MIIICGYGQIVTINETNNNIKKKSLIPHKDS